MIPINLRYEGLRRANFREDKETGEISKEIGRTRQTIRKYVKQGENDQ